ncbi:MAG: DUF3592 domain-containing protein [Planctomycetaceae bacterium]|nr:DUF3592 domain-containing protein [Planctomycetaceae bacterium]MCL2304387.1 DUF3592 domain-containing protein [Planctomycetaceae bacterium]
MPSRKKTTAELYIFCTIFLVGFVFFWLHGFAWVLPQWKMLSESVSGDCTVLETRIESREEESATLYRPEIRIKFTAGEGTVVIWTYDADTLTQSGGFSTNRKTAEKVVSQFEAGKTYTCWYHPNDPEKAVLKRETSIWGWYFLAIPISLMFSGVCGIWWSLRIFSVSEERRAASNEKRKTSPLALLGGASPTLLPTVPDSRIINESPGTSLAFRLPVSSLPSLRLIVLTIFTIVWNTISWTILVWSLYHSSGARHELLYSTMFGLVFCGFGLLLTIWILRDLLTAFGIGPTLFEISDHPIYPGRKYRILVIQTGMLRFRSLSIVLVCEEIARFRQGTDTITSRKEVYSQPLFFREDFETTQNEPLRQEFFMRLPHGAMHSMVLEHNEIVWKIVLRANLLNWPELHCECPVIVLPHAVSEDRG